MSVNNDDGILADVTNKVNTLNVNEEAMKRVQEANWAAPLKYDYEAYNAAQKDERSAAPAEGGESNNVPAWAANAAKYEWKEEYGEVGPKWKPLEDQLYGSEFKMQKGNEYSK